MCLYPPLLPSTQQPRARRCATKQRAAPRLLLLKPSKIIRFLARQSSPSTNFSCCVMSLLILKAPHACGSYLKAPLFFGGVISKRIQRLKSSQCFAFGCKSGSTRDTCCVCSCGFARGIAIPVGGILFVRVTVEWVKKKQTP